MKEIKLNELDLITGGGGKEREEILAFIRENYPDVKTNSAKQLQEFFKSHGIINITYHPNCPNIYHDKDGNELTHEQFMEILNDSLEK